MNNNRILGPHFYIFVFGIYYSFEGIVLNSCISTILISFCFRHIFFLYGSILNFKILIYKLYFDFIRSCFYIITSLVHVHLYVSTDNALRSVLSKEQGFTWRHISTVMEISC